MTAFNPMNSILVPPSTNFVAVRDRRNSPVFYVDIDLTTSRSLAAATAITLPISGNAFYIDANPLDGNAIVHFQDTNFDRSSVPLYVSPGSIFNIPFTQVLIENSAQPGKRIRIAYGVDVDFQPGSVAQVTISNAGGYTSVRPESSTNSFNDITLATANTAIMVFAPAANINGAIVMSAQSFSASNVAHVSCFIIKSAAPSSVADGEIICLTQFSANVSAIYSNYSSVELKNDVYVPAGKGLYYISNCTEITAALRGARYKLL